MTESFLARMPTLSDAELRRYLDHPQGYKTEAVEAALAELGRRGQAVPEDDLARIRHALRERDAARKAELEAAPSRLFGATPETRMARIRRLSTGLLAAGLGSAVVIYLTAAPQAANPLGYEPEDTKKYLRDLEIYGGKANVVATQFQHWFDGLWRGRQLAFTVAVLTILLALAFWFLATRLAVGAGQPPEDGAPSAERP